MMRERGSINGLRYPYAHRIKTIEDVEFEACAPNIYLAYVPSQIRPFMVQSKKSRKGFRDSRMAGGPSAGHTAIDIKGKEKLLRRTLTQGTRECAILGSPTYVYL